MKCPVVYLLMIGFTLSGCSLDPYGQKDFSLSLDIVGSDPALDLSYSLSQPGRVGVYSAPTALSGFGCLAVNIVGPGISAGDGGTVGSGVIENLFSQNSYCSYPGVTSAPFSVSGASNIELKVPSGAGRLIQIVGITSGSAVCNLTTPIGKTRGNSGTDYYEVGRMLIDLFQDRRIEISNSYDSLTATNQELRKINCGEASKTLVFTSSSTVSYVTCTPITLQTQDGSGNAVTVTSDLSLSLSSSLGFFYQSSGCSATTNVATVSSGSSSVQLYFQSSTAGSSTISASDSSSVYLPASQTLTIQ